MKGSLKNLLTRKGVKPRGPLKPGALFNMATAKAAKNKSKGVMCKSCGKAHPLGKHVKGKK